MEFHNLDLNLLVALDALLAERNVTRAGKRIHLSQSATSGVLARLRDYFNNDLLVPAGRTMVLTPLAQSLVQPVHEILLQIQHTVAAKAEFDPATSTRTFSIAAADDVSTVFLAEVLQEAARQAPHVRFELVSMDEQMDERLENGLVDFAVRPSVAAPPRHPVETLYEESYTCVAWTGNSALKKGPSPNWYFDLGHVIVRLGRRLVMFEEWFATEHGHTRRIEAVAPSFELACRLVVGTDRIATVLTRMARLCARHMPLRILQPPIATPTITEVLQWHRHQDRDPGHLWFRNIAKQVAARIAASNAPPDSLRSHAARARSNGPAIGASARVGRG